MEIDKSIKDVIGKSHVMLLVLCVIRRGKKDRMAVSAIPKSYIHIRRRLIWSFTDDETIVF